MNSDLFHHGRTRPAASQSTDPARCTAQRDHKLQPVTFLAWRFFNHLMPLITASRQPDPVILGSFNYLCKSIC